MADGTRLSKTCPAGDVVMAASTPAVQTGGGTIRKSKWGRSTRRPRASSHGFQSVSEEGNKPPQETSSEPGGLAGTVAGGVTSLVSTLLGAVGAGTTRSQAPDASDVALDESAPPLSVQPPASLQASTRGAPPQKKKPLPAQEVSQQPVHHHALLPRAVESRDVLVPTVAREPKVPVQHQGNPARTAQAQPMQGPTEDLPSRDLAPAPAQPSVGRLLAKYAARGSLAALRGAGKAARLAARLTAAAARHGAAAARRGYAAAAAAHAARKAAREAAKAQGQAPARSPAPAPGRPVTYANPVPPPALSPYAFKTARAAQQDAASSLDVDDAGASFESARSWAAEQTLSFRKSPVCSKAKSFVGVHIVPVRSHSPDREPARGTGLVQACLGQVARCVRPADRSLGKSWAPQPDADGSRFAQAQHDAYRAAAPSRAYSRNRGMGPSTRAIPVQ